jgi:hypothetical protein
MSAGRLLDLRRARGGALLAVAALAFAAILATRKPHVYEFVHFFLGAKYFPEVGYTGLYNDLAAAFEEIHGREGLLLRVDEVTDLARVGALTPEEAVRAHGAEPRRWSAARWLAFKADVAFLEVAMERYSTRPHLERWRELFMDYGNNFPPAWVAWVHPLTRDLPLRQGSMVALCAIDAVLLACVFAAVWAAWGPGAAVTGLVFVASATDLMAYASWSLGKFDWLAALALALLLLERGRPAAAGALWGVAASLRLFPVLPAAVFTWIWSYRRLTRGEGLRAPARFAAAAATAFLGLNAAATVLVARWSGLAPRELWARYLDRLDIYQRAQIVNRIGLVKLAEVAHGTVPPLVGSLAGAALGALLLVALLRWRPPPSRLAALTLLFAPLTFTLSHYYYLFLLLPLAAGGRRLAWLAAVLVAVNAGVIAAKLAGAPYESVLQGECGAYSLALVLVPAVLFFRGSGDSATMAPDMTAEGR